MELFLQLGSCLLVFNIGCFDLQLQLIVRDLDLLKIIEKSLSGFIMLFIKFLSLINELLLHLIDLLLELITTNNRLCNRVIHIVNSLDHTFSEITTCILVT